MKTPKRPCYYSNHSISSNPNNNNNNLLESLINNTDPASLTTSFNQILESQSKQNDFIQRAIDISSALLEAANRSRCERASAHNAFVWPFPYDLTVKVFSMIDTQSVCNVAATCSFFHKCAMDPLCYADIDLVTLVPMVGFERTLVPKVNDVAVSTMIQRAGNALHLRSLHLHNIKRMDNTALLATLSVCPSLIDLEIVCLYVQWKLTLESVSKHIPLIERLICESSSEDEHAGLEYATCRNFIRNCPNITTLALKGFEMPDFKARKLVKGFRKLKYVDFSNTYHLFGSFLKNLGTNGGGENLEVMILRDTRHLKQVRVKQFLEALLAGAWKSLRHLDISHTEGLASKHDWSIRVYSTSFIPIKQLLQQRPNFRLLAEFGKSHSESEVIRSDGSLSSQSGSDTSDGSPYTSTSDDGSPYTSTSDGPPYTSTSDSSYISDQDSGSDESSDDVDHHPELHKLKYVNFSTSSSFTGSFLKNLGTIGVGNNLEVMILRDARNLRKVKVKKFLAAIVAGEWRSLRHLDISQTSGLKRNSFYKKFRKSSIIKQLLEQRPNFRLVAEFGDSDSEESSDSNSSSQSSNESLDGDD